VAVDDWVRGTNNRPDLTTVICDGLEYKLLKGDALRCDLSPQGMLVIQNKNYKYGATGTYEIIQ